MKPCQELIEILQPAYQPCVSFAGPCTQVRWNPSAGHVPRGFAGGAGDVSEIDLVLVFAEPGDPHPGETHGGLDSAYDHAMKSFGRGTDLFHRNVRLILNSCWPDLDFNGQMRKAWLTESVLCSAAKEGGSVPAATWRECGHRYLVKQLSSVPDALVVALGGKARDRLRSIGVSNFLEAGSVAPPGCNRREVRASWRAIPEELRRRAAQT